MPPKMSWAAMAGRGIPGQPDADLPTTNRRGGRGNAAAGANRGGGRGGANAGNPATPTTPAAPAATRANRGGAHGGAHAGQPAKPTTPARGGGGRGRGGPGSPTRGNRCGLGGDTVLGGRVEPVGARGGHGGRGNNQVNRGDRDRGRGGGRGRGRGRGDSTIPDDGRQGATNTRASGKCRAVQLDPRMDLVEPGGAVAVDVEGVQVLRQVGAAKQGLGRISIVNEAGDVILDTFANYPRGANATPNHPKFGLGVVWEDIKAANGAQKLERVLEMARAIFDKSGIVVAHAMSNEKNFLGGLVQDGWEEVVKRTKHHEEFTIPHPAINIPGVDLGRYELRDTQKLPEYKEYSSNGTPGLKTLAKEVLGIDLQTGEHSSVEDAQATMQLYVRRKDAFEAAAAAAVAWEAGRGERERQEREEQRRANAIA